MSLNAFKSEDFDESDPAAFYLLGPGRADMEALADATLVVLSLQSGVLRGLFADLRGGQDGGGAQRGRKRKTAEYEDGMVLEAPFEGSSLFDACLFLRFCYRLSDLTPANLTAAADSLAGLLRLAHKLDAPQIQQAVCGCMAGNLQYATTQQLLQCAAAADRCQLAELRASLISEVARRLTSGPGGQPGAAAEAVLVAEHCDRSVLAQLLESLADVARRGAIPGSFEWALERYSEQPSAVGQRVVSPWFASAGNEWRFMIYPGGSREGEAGHLSVYMECVQPGTRAKCTITLVDQAAQGAVYITRSTTEAKLLDGGWGGGKFITRERLRSRPGYLAGDRLVLRANIEVLL